MPHDAALQRNDVFEPLALFIFTGYVLRDNRFWNASTDQFPLTDPCGGRQDGWVLVLRLYCIRNLQSPPALSVTQPSYGGVLAVYPLQEVELHCMLGYAVLKLVE